MFILLTLFYNCKIFPLNKVLHELSEHKVLFKSIFFPRITQAQLLLIKVFGFICCAPPKRCLVKEL